MQRLRTKDDIATASWAYCVGLSRLQGAVSHNDKFYISQSGLGPLTASKLIGWTPEKGDGKHLKVPAGSEDMTYNPIKNTIGTVTEYRGKRYILEYNSDQFE